MYLRSCREAGNDLAMAMGFIGLCFLAVVKRESFDIYSRSRLVDGVLTDGVLTSACQRRLMERSALVRVSYAYITPDAPGDNRPPFRRNLGPHH